MSKTKLDDLFAQFMVDMQDAEIEAARANPQRHRLIRLFPEGLRWRYWRAGKDGRDRQVRFCYTTRPNAAGYFLIWREVRSKTKGKRDQFEAIYSRRAARDASERRMKEWHSKRDEAIERRALPG